MNFKTGILAAGIFLAAASANSQEAVSNGSFTGGLSDWTFSSGVNRVLSNATDRGVVDTGLAGANWLTQSFYLAAGQYTLAFDGLFNGSASTLAVSLGDFSEIFTGSQIAGAKSFTFDVASSGIYDLIFSGRARSSLVSFVAVDNVSLSATVAVPGPEAGAGLGALAMGGLAFWINRRRKESANA